MASFDPEKITFFAKTDARGRENTFGIKAKDRQRHMYIVGKTGMGKTTLLENLAAQDILGDEGMAFIDPHGSAAESLLDYVPEHRTKDVIYFAPFDLDYPVSFNVMEDVGPDKRHLVVSGLMSTFKKVWVDAWSPRMEYILTNTLFALIEYPNTTLLSVSRMLADKAYRKQVVEYIKDPAVKSFWVDEFANYTDRFAAEALPAIQNKIGQFTLNPLIRNIIGQPKSSFDIRKIMDEKKILIMNLSKGLIGETNANLLGSMLTTRIYLAAMSRANLGVEEMRVQPNFYFYVDEFQSFANATFANILSEARKYHLNLIIAHQYIAQMEEEVRDAVFGNVGTTISFRVGPFDGEVLETVFAPQFTATDLVNLGFAQIYLTLMIDGIGSQPFSATTLPPIQRPLKSMRTQVVAHSRELYASDRPEVEKAIDEMHMPIETPGKKQNNKSKNKSDFGKKKDGPTKRASNGPQSSHELKAILAQVAGDNGGANAPSQTTKKENEESQQKDRDTQKQAEPSASDVSETEKETIQNDTKEQKRAVNPGLEAEMKRFKDLEDSSKTAEKQKKTDSQKNNDNSGSRKDTRESRSREEKKASDNDSSQSTRQKQSDSNSKETDSSTDTDSDSNTDKNQTRHQDSDQTNQSPHENANRKSEYFRDVEVGKQANKSQKNQTKHSKTSNHTKHKGNTYQDNRQQLKNALAEVLQEEKQKEALKVPDFTPVDEKTKNSTPTVRVVKPPDDVIPEPPPKPATPQVAKEDNPLDPKKIKNMLQTSKHETSPFNS